MTDKELLFPRTVSGIITVDVSLGTIDVMVTDRNNT
jgi:hypothetical protein